MIERSDEFSSLKKYCGIHENYDKASFTFFYLKNVVMPVIEY